MKIFCINLILFLTVLILIDITLIFFEDSFPELRRVYSNNHRMPDPYTGRRYIPNLKTQVKGIYQDAISYDYSMSIDEFGRRYTPQQNNNKKSEHFLFFGCSMVEGVGVPDNQTAPSYFSHLTSNYQIYNYAAGGWGASHVLSLLEHKELSNEVPEKSGIGVYVYYDFHLNRSIVSRDTSTWIQSAPYYSFDKMLNYKFEGLFESVRPFPFSLYEVLSKSIILKRLRVELPPINEGHYKKVVQMLRGIHLEFKRQFPGSDFYIILIGNSQKNLENHLLRHKVPYLKVQAPFEQEFIIPHDGHYNSKGNQLLAERILQALAGKLK